MREDACSQENNNYYGMIMAKFGRPITSAAAGIGSRRELARVSSRGSRDVTYTDTNITTVARMVIVSINFTASNNRITTLWLVIVSEVDALMSVFLLSMSLILASFFFPFFYFLITSTFSR